MATKLVQPKTGSFGSAPRLFMHELERGSSGHARAWPSSVAAGEQFKPILLHQRAKSLGSGIKRTCNFCPLRRLYINQG